MVQTMRIPWVLVGIQLGIPDWHRTFPLPFIYISNPLKGFFHALTN